MRNFLFVLFFKCGFCPSKCYKVITSATVNNEQEAPSFENLRYDPLENSKNILLENYADSDLRFFSKS